MSAITEGRKQPSPAQRAWLARGLDQPGGKLPLFDADGGRIDPRTMRSCIDQGWAAPWFDNPLKPDWLVCRLTEAGRIAAEEAPRPALVQPIKNGPDSSVISLKKYLN